MSGGGYHCGVDDGIINSIIWGNTATARVQAEAPDFAPNPDAPPTVNHSCIGEDPGFEADGYRLSADLDSPCIDGGVNAPWMKSATDLAGNSRINNGKVDIGAYEFRVKRIIGLSGGLAFGNVLTGQTATATLTITNRGNRALTVSGIAYPPGFSGAWSGLIPAQGAHEVTVRFRPRAAMTYGGLATVHSDSTSGKGTINVTGTGVRPCQFCFSASAYSAHEGVPRKIAVKRINGTAGESSVDYVMKPITAQAWQDFTPASGTLTWTNGETASKTILIDVPADSDSEAAETFQVTLKTPVGASLAAPSKTVVTILD
ncbi:MAG: choice-of-anchor D domain-containing protein [Kiritimatiellia bacterium]